MLHLDFHPSGRHFLQIPGPSPVPDRILRAMSYPTIDHRGPEFGALGLKVLAGIKKIFKTTQPVVIYPASGTGAWEAALTNTLSAGDTVLAAAATSSLAYIVDYKVVPQRLQPGFDAHVSRRSIGAFYVTFAAALAATAWLQRRP